MLLPGRHANTSDYRYGFQGQELDNEIKGEGNSYNFTFRMHDPRVGRFFSMDPLTHKFTRYTPYQFSGNSVIGLGELEGLEETGLWSAHYYAQQAGKAMSDDEGEAAVIGANIYTMGSIAAFTITGISYGAVSGGLYFAELAIANPLLFAELSNEATAFIWGLATDEIYINPLSGGDEIGQFIRRSFVAGGLGDDLIKNGSKVLREIRLAINPTNSKANCVDCAIQFQRLVVQGANDIIAKASDGVPTSEVVNLVKKVFGESNVHVQSTFKNNAAQLFEGLSDVGQESAIIVGKLKTPNGKITDHAFNAIRDSNGTWTAVDAQTGNILDKGFLDRVFSYFTVIETIVDDAVENVSKN